jgi:hypothetical protein
LRLIIVIGLIAVQLFVSLFYASAALAMWGPFMSAPTASKLLIATVITIPVVSFLIAYDRIRIGRLGTIASVGLIALLQIALVLIFVMTSGRAALWPPIRKSGHCAAA